jgi:uncharacterized protein
VTSPSKPSQFGSRNVLGQPLVPCSENPMTGYYRDGCCEGHNDPGAHVICVQMTEDFLKFSVATGNDLVTPRPEYNFPGLKAGDWWCLVAARWAHAQANGVAPRVSLASTHEMALEYTTLDALMAHAVDHPN